MSDKKIARALFNFALWVQLAGMGILLSDAIGQKPNGGDIEAWAVWFTSLLVSALLYLVSGAMEP